MELNDMIDTLASLIDGEDPKTDGLSELLTPIKEYLELSLEHPDCDLKQRLRDEDLDLCDEAERAIERLESALAAANDDRASLRQELAASRRRVGPLVAAVMAFYDEWVTMRTNQD